MTDESDVTKVVIVGESGVGKTCIIERFCENTFTQATVSTIGAANASAKVTVGDTTLDLDIWDTAGQELYRSLNKIFYKNAKIAILVYDITKKTSFEEMKNYWFEQIKKVNGDDAVIVIAGNKCDLYDKEEVSEDEAKEFANQNDCVFQLTSAFSGSGVKELFQLLGEKLIQKNGGPIPVEDEDNNSKKKKEKGNIKLKEQEQKPEEHSKCCR